MITDVWALPAGVLVALGVLATSALVLDAIALVDLYRRPAELVVFGKKWVWLLVILFLNLLGPVLYLLAGRKPSPPAGTPQAVRSKQTAAADAVAKLYGPPDHPRRR